MQPNTHAIDISALGRDKRSLDLATEQVAIEVPDLSLFYGQKQALYNVSMNIPRQRVTAFIGPSGCGKSTLLRCFNRMNDLVDGCRIEGEINLDGHNIYRKGEDVADLRRRVGMVFQKPNPFPKSIYENVVYGLRIQGIKQKRVLDETVEWALKGAALWDEVKQQQPLCIARAIAVKPEIILMDEPASALDPIATSRIEDLIHELKEQYTIVIVTHNMQQASRVSDYTAFFMANEERAGTLVEYGPTAEFFTNPKDKRTEDYITGRFG